MILFTESRCEPVPSVRHASPNTTLTNEGTFVSYACLPGYKCDAGDIRIVARCVEGEWKLNDIRCISRNILIRVVIMISNTSIFMYPFSKKGLYILIS